ncbi:MAG: hypothetical protein HQK65_11935 [Desulfamplus sp.]|nr:hypothetical protein [Desulfamplus sp.]
MDIISMDKNKLINNRVIFGRICVLAFLITLAGILDGLISSYRKPVNDIDIITERPMEIVGKVYGKVTTPDDIIFISDSPNLTLLLDKDIFSSHWFGEDMWRGHLKANSSLRPGQYNIKIKFRDVSMIKPDDREKVEKLSEYRVNVYSDAKAMRQSDLSLIKRFTAISPWLIAIVFFPIVLISGGLIFIISGRVDTEMANNGLAEIYRVSKHDEGLEVFFGLGSTHGVEPGEKMHLFNEKGDLVTEIVVENIGRETSSAVISMPKIRPGCIVARILNRELLCH